MVRTGLEESPELSAAAGVPVRLKLEFLQKTGSFKIRGAIFQISRLSETDRRRGVVTCSAGNHGKAVAAAARQAAVPVTVCVPRSVDRAKLRGIRDAGAEVRISEFPGYDETEDWALGIAAAEGKKFLSAFDDVDVMAANGGTIAAEIVADAPDSGVFVLPVGGGGLAGGVSFLARERDPRAVIVACQHAGSPGLALSLDRGEAVTRLPAIETSAGGIEGGIGRIPFGVLRSRVDRVALLSEGEIEDAVRWLIDRHGYLVEPSAAVGVAAILTGKAGRFSSPAAVVLTGRNVSIETVARIVAAARA
ncbi:MAG TPA: pyridoxal-phosphate dependent enzyme [Thermoanaerobaculia bacterium]|nr:pyridoxal-phosphate dependent enzyme [Thermoanaerobaculia bacterium]